MTPLVLGFVGKLPLEAAFVALAAQNIAMVDVRGAYTLRLGVLAAMTVVLAASAGLGAFVAQHVFAAIALTALLTLASGAWRHLSSDYGPSLSIASLLVFFLALAAPEGTNYAAHHAWSVLAGGAFGILLQIAYWPIHPQHPLRRTVAESWLAAADLFAALVPSQGVQVTERHEKVTTAENALRQAIDKAAISLIQASSRRRSAVIDRLESLNLCAARLAVRVSALNTALESCMSENTLADAAPALQAVLTGLTNTARTVALAAVSRQPAHIAACEVRLRRLKSLLRVLSARLQGGGTSSPCRTQLESVLQSIQRQIPAIGDSLRQSVERADERAAFSLELFDLNTWMLRPLAATLNLDPKIESALLRYTLRLTVLTTLGVAAFKLLRLPHGYWLPFTAVVVLQPDYGATRQKAAQRMLGTVTGSVAATALLWLRPPPSVGLTLIGICVFIFGYTLRRNYALAIFFVTVFVVLMMEATGPITAAVAGERVAATLVGGLLAVLAAMIFWPVWERDRFPPVLAQALRANADYLEGIVERIARGAPRDEEVAVAKRVAEDANATMFASLKRMFGDPKNQREGLEQSAALANGNQRLTRIFNLLFVHLGQSGPVHAAQLVTFVQLASSTLRSLADNAQEPNAAAVELWRAQLDAFGAENTRKEDRPQSSEMAWLELQMGRAVTELSAMIVALENEASGPSATPEEPAEAHSARTV